jgi:hypothetical protein
MILRRSQRLCSDRSHGLGDNGVPVSVVCRKIGMVEKAFYRYREKYAGMEPTEARRVPSARGAAGHTPVRVPPRRPSRARRPAARAGGEAPRAGYRTLWRLLRRAGGKANHKRVHRLYRAEGLGLRVKRRRRSAAAPRQEPPPVTSGPMPTGSSFTSAARASRSTTPSSRASTAGYATSASTPTGSTAWSTRGTSSALGSRTTTSAGLTARLPGSRQWSTKATSDIADGLKKGQLVGKLSGRMPWMETSAMREREQFVTDWEIDARVGRVNFAALCRP